uniref:Uncharacterized protein n=1 Tax=Poecilia formosa TaxID=48698 RepID=A0A087XQP2_POEFO
NKEAERAVKTIKNLLKKAADPYLALLTYRATPLNGYSPAELLMGRRLCTTVPTLRSLLKPFLPKQIVAQKEMERRIKDAERYNSRHRATVLSKLTPGQGVWIKDQGTSGAVITSHSTPRSYIVEGPHGSIRRNRRHLVAIEPSTEQQVQQSPEEPTQQSLPELSPTSRTRFGRRVVKPDRLNL